jgi:hypothetical protein
MSELTSDNFETIQGLVMSVAQDIRRTSGYTLKQAHPYAMIDIANLLDISPHELSEYLTRQLFDRRVTAKSENKLLVKVEELSNEREEQQVLHDLLVKQLQGVPPGLGKRLTFATPTIAEQAHNQLPKVCREIWNGVLHGHRMRFFQAKRNNKVLEVWRLA